MRNLYKLAFYSSLFTFVYFGNTHLAAPQQGAKFWQLFRLIKANNRKKVWKCVVGIPKKQPNYIQKTSENFKLPYMKRKSSFAAEFNSQSISWGFHRSNVKPLQDFSLTGHRHLAKTKKSRWESESQRGNITVVASHYGWCHLLQKILKT